MDRHRNTTLKLFLTATLALSAIIGLALTGCSPLENATLTKTVVSPVTTEQATTLAKTSVSPTTTTTNSLTRTTNLLILHTNDVAGYVDPCG